MKFSSVLIFKYCCLINVFASSQEPFAIDVDDRSNETIFPSNQNEVPSSRFHTPGEMQSDAINKDVTNNRSESSVLPTPPINLDDLIDRKKYLKEHVEELIETEKRFGASSQTCRWCNVGWFGLGGTATASSFIISSIGSTEYLNPKIANVINISLCVVVGACLWAANQSRKAAHEYHLKKINIQRSLGVPERLIDPELNLRIDPFQLGEGNNNLGV